MTFDHSLCREKSLDFISQVSDIAIFPEPFRSLCTETEALKSKADASLAVTSIIRFLVAFLATDPTSITARLGTNRTFGLGRSGLLRMVCL